MCRKEETNSILVHNFGQFQTHHCNYFFPNNVSKNAKLTAQPPSASSI